MIVNTPKGIIEAKPSTDPNYPGIWISVNGIELVLVDWVDHLNGHVVRVWDNDRADEDYEYSQFIEAKENE